MYPSPVVSLAATTVQELDDQFFTSDPHAYIRCRIASLLTEARAISGPLAEEFSQLLGPSAAQFRALDDRAAKLQVAVDAFALRHQVAETLLRFMHVVLHHVNGNSFWVELTDTPMKMVHVIEDNHTALTADGVDAAAVLRSLLLPPDFGPEATAGLASAAHDEDERTAADLLDDGLALHVEWVNHAIALFTQESPDLDAAHNKFKHGMGLRPQDDVLSTLTFIPPNADGDLPLSALTGPDAVNLFDGITTEFLARPSRKHGLEATQLVMLPAPTLVEAAALAHTLALLFHSAAARHFQDHEPHGGRAIPQHPGLMVDGPRPGTLRPHRPFAMRFPLTTPLRDPKDKEALLFWTDGAVQAVAFGPFMQGRVIDDSVVDHGSPATGAPKASDKPHPQMFGD